MGNRSLLSFGEVSSFIFSLGFSSEIFVVDFPAEEKTSAVRDK
jgi:hypothetical protein